VLGVRAETDEMLGISFSKSADSKYYKKHMCVIIAGPMK
jgi:hypothetical protein